MLSEQGCRERAGRSQTWCRDNDVDLAVVSDGKDIFYFTGFLRRQYGWMIPRVEQFACSAEGGTLLLCCESLRGAAEISTVQHVATYQDYDITETTETYLDHALEPLERGLRHLAAGVSKIGLEKRHTPVLIHDLLRQMYPDAEFVDVSDVILSMRRRKDTDEIQSLRRVAELSGSIYQVAASEISPGETEADIYAACNAAVAKKVDGFVTFAGDFLSGKRAYTVGVPGAPTTKALRDNETMILDLWLDPYGYWADSARGFIVGEEPNKEQTKLHNLVMEAMKKGEESLLPGTKGKGVYAEIRNVFHAAGLAEYFPLHAGHGLGLSPHEAPLLIPGSSDTLEAGMVCTLEPGLYIPDLCGLRCEDMYLITENGPQRLTNFSRTMGWG